MYVLILDTETTGLFPRGAASTPLKPPQTPSAPTLYPSTQRGATSAHYAVLKTPACPSTQRGSEGGSAPLPYAVQISYAIIDTSSPFFPIVEDYDAIIRISEETPLPAESVAIHGITREISQTKGVPIEHALSILQRSLDTYDVQLVVGHNIAFDLRVLATEYSRQGATSAPLRPPPRKSFTEGATSAHYAVLQPPLCPSPSSSPDPTSTPEGATSAPFNPSAQVKNKPTTKAQAGGLRGLCPLPDPTSTPGGDEHPLQPLRADKYLKKSLVPTQAGGLRGLCPLQIKNNPPRELCHLPSFCTARESVGVCNLRAESMYGGTYLKFGKLGQVFEILFKERDAARGVDMKVFEKYMHNSRVDVLMCARVYVWLCYSVDVFDAWYREMQNYADEDFINVDDSHLVGGGGVERPLRPLCGGATNAHYAVLKPLCGGATSAHCADSNSESSASPVRVRGASPLASPRRSDRLRLKRMRDEVSILVM